MRKLCVCILLVSDKGVPGVGGGYHLSVTSVLIGESEKSKNTHGHERGTKNPYNKRAMSQG